MRKIIIGTRSSELAVTQTNWVIDALKEAGVENEFEIKTISTKGDRNIKDALHKVGRKGIFSTDLQDALEQKDIDFAVHSLKDLSLYDDERFLLASFPQREDHRDAYIGRTNIPLKELEKGSVIGTSSPRRAAFIRALYPHLKTESIRGPVQMRLEQLRQGKYDGIVLAVAGLKRLNLLETITEYLPYETFTPAVGQGALVIECRREDEEIIHLLRKINHEATEKSVITEREFVRLLDEDDEAPIGAYADIVNDNITLYGSISSLNGDEIITVQAKGSVMEQVAEEAAYKAKEQGANAIIDRAKEELSLQ